MYGHLRPDPGLPALDSLAVAAPLAEPTWIRDLLDAAAFLALGGFVLLASLLVLYTPASASALAFVSVCALEPVAIGVHAYAWFLLGRGVSRFARAAPESNAAIGLVAAYVLSIGGFVAGLGIMGFGRPPSIPLPAFFLAYLPLAWAPVVFAHALVFGIALWVTRDDFAIAATAGGGALLVALGVLGLAGQAGLLPLGLHVLMLAGATGFAYSAIGIGLRRAAIAGVFPGAPGSPRILTVVRWRRRSAAPGPVGGSC